MSHSVIVDIRIDAEEYLKLYAGVAKDAKVQCRDGRRVQFPARILRPFVTHSGIDGSFRITFDEQMKFQNIERI